MHLRLPSRVFLKKTMAVSVESPMPSVLGLLRQPRVFLLLNQASGREAHKWGQCLLIFQVVTGDHFHLSQTVLRRDPSARHKAASELQLCLSCSWRGWAGADGSKHFANTWFLRQCLELSAVTSNQRKMSWTAHVNSLISKRPRCCLLSCSLLEVLLSHACKKGTGAGEGPPTL